MYRFQKLLSYIRKDSQSSMRPKPPTLDINLCMKTFFESHACHNQPSFTVDIAPSKLQSAGNGVFVSGKVEPLQIVSFYPGFYIPPPPEFSIISSSGESCLRQGEVIPITSIYRMCCSTVGGAIDASGYTRPILPYCVGDIVNHPPKGRLPNVFPFDFSWRKVMESSKDWNKNSQEQLIRYKSEVNRIGDGLWYVDGTTLDPVYLSSTRQHCDAGVVLVSLTNISDGEELFMDYQFNLSEELPAWYSPVNYSKSMIHNTDMNIGQSEIGRSSSSTKMYC